MSHATDQRTHLTAPRHHGELSTVAIIINGATIGPKRKFRISPLNGAAAGGVTLEQLVVKIIVGPNGASARSAMAVRRMLETLGTPGLAGRVVTSTTPYRAK
ncbi:hypothetical protein [Paraburkholderia unamae]|uniref:Uncharacterized protein n=1 Tax=Paraburkholderia unamae TaxID=219649 RepID=A0ACC6RU79_9BURK